MNRSKNCHQTRFVSKNAHKKYSTVLPPRLWLNNWPKIWENEEEDSGGEKMPNRMAKSSRC